MLEEAKERLNIALGTSNGFYKYCELYPIYGSGEGVSTFPVIWLVASSTMGEIYKDKCQGAEFLSCDKSFSVILALLEFVDGVTNQANMFSYNNVPPETFILVTPKDSQLWSNLLWMAG
eukprot:3132732-Ditylum_brightwellii.AAC.1